MSGADLTVIVQLAAVMVVLVGCLILYVLWRLERDVRTAREAQRELFRHINLTTIETRDRLHSLEVHVESLKALPPKGEEYHDSPWTVPPK